MSMSPDELAELQRLKQRVDALERRSTRLVAAETRVLAHARQYARLTTMQYMLDTRNGEQIACTTTDARYHADMWLDHLKEAAVQLLREETSSD